MATNDIGRVTPIWRGFFSAATTYELNDIVIDTAGSVWWHKSEEQTTGVIPEAGEIWDAVIDMSVFSALIQAAITTAQTAVQAAQEAESEVAEDVRRAETAAQSAEASAASASESAAGVGALAQAAEQSKTEAQTAATQAAASASSAGASATSAGSSAQTAEAAKTAAQTAATQAAGSAETASGAAAVVEQKKAEALAAIEAKGEEVLESIPEDYTELSGDVGDLKTQITYSDGLYKQFHVNANTQHSSGNDKVNVSIKTGDKFVIAYSRNYTNSMLFYGYDSSNASHSLHITINKKTGFDFYTAEYDFVSIGAYVAPDENADDYVFVVGKENTPIYDFYVNTTTTDKSANELLELLTYDGMPKTFHVNANTFHGANADSIAVNIASGESFVWSFSRHYNNVIMLYGYDSGGTSYGFTTSYDKTGRIICTAPANLVSLGVSVNNYENADDYTFAIGYANSEMYAVCAFENAINLFASNVQKFRVSANTTHSSTLDKLPVDIKAGDKFVVVWSRDYENTLAFYGYDSSNVSHTLHLAPTNKYGYAIVTAEYDFVAIGLYVSSNVSSGYYTFGVGAENTALYELYRMSDIIGDTRYPKYYQTEIASAIGNINDNVLGCGIDGDSFVFFSDIHWNRNNKHSANLMKDIIRNTEVDKIICGGDIIDNGTRALMISQMRDFVDNYKDVARFYCLFGNHDTNQVGTTSGDYLTKSEAYALIQKESDFIMQYGNLCYFYFDNPTTKTRYICLDTGIEGTTLDSTQSEWLSATLNDMPSGYHAIVFAHIIYMTTTTWHVGLLPSELAMTPFMTDVCTILDTFNTANNDKTVEAIFGGHVHIDADFATTGGIPIVLIDTDSVGTFSTVDGTNPNSATGTVNEQCFDVVTINYDTKTIDCVRIGRGVDRTITY